MGPAFGGPDSDADDNADLTRGGAVPGLPDWLNLDVIVPAAATVIVICVGIIVVCVAVTRRKQPHMTPGPYKMHPHFGSLQYTNLVTHSEYHTFTY